MAKSKIEQLASRPETRDTAAFLNEMGLYPLTARKVAEIAVWADWETRASNAQWSQDHNLVNLMRAESLGLPSSMSQKSWTIADYVRFAPESCARDVNKWFESHE